MLGLNSLWLAALKPTPSPTPGPTPTPSDSTPDAFSFTDQTDVARSTVITSAPITVAGIDTAAAISISGGEYQIGSGSWVSSAGTVINGQTVKARLTSSASYATIASAIVTIGGISDTFSATTVSAPTPSPSPTWLYSALLRNSNGMPDPVPAGVPGSPIALDPSDHYNGTTVPIGTSGGDPTAHDSNGGSDFGVWFMDFASDHMVVIKTTPGVQIEVFLRWAIAFGASDGAYDMYDGNFVYLGPTLHSESGNTAAPVGQAQDANGTNHTIANFFANQTGVLVTPTQDHISILGLTGGGLTWVGVRSVA